MFYKIAKCEAAVESSNAQQDKTDSLLRYTVDCMQIVHVNLGKNLENSKSTQKMKEETLRYHDYLIRKQLSSSINCTYWPEKNCHMKK